LLSGPDVAPSNQRRLFLVFWAGVAHKRKTAIIYAGFLTLDGFLGKP
jgi:hypothetical protein